MQSHWRDATGVFTPFHHLRIWPSLWIFPSCCSGGLQMPKAINLQSKSMCRAVRGKGWPCGYLPFFLFLFWKNCRALSLDLMTRIPMHSRSCVTPAFFPACSHWRLASLSLQAAGTAVLLRHLGDQRLQHPRLLLTCSHHCADPP